MLTGDSGVQVEKSVLHYTEVELLEISAVPIPANRDSMVLNGLEDLDPEVLKALRKEIGDEVLARVSEVLKGITQYQKDGFNQVLESMTALSNAVASIREGQGTRKANGGSPVLNDVAVNDFRSMLGL
jgi:hypothetical protein